MVNWALFLSYMLSIIIMIGLPIFLAFVVVRVFKVSWWVVLIGVGTFIVSQVVHIPALAGVNALFSKGTLPIPSANWLPLINGVITGLLAAITEETARWVGFKVLGDRVKKFGTSLALGVGHGGAESIILCILGTAWSLATVLLYNAGGELARGTSMANVQSMLGQISQFWAQPVYLGLLPGLERIIALSTQILLSILVWKAVVNHNFWWFLLALAYHTAIDAVSVFLSQTGMASYLIEGVLFLFFLLNVYLIYRFITDETEAEEEDEEDEDEEGEADDEDEAAEEEGWDDDESDELTEGEEHVAEDNDTDADSTSSDEDAESKPEN